MSNSMGEINKAIRELRLELRDVHGDASLEKRAKCMEIIDTITFHVLGKLLMDIKPEDRGGDGDETLHDLTRST